MNQTPEAERARPCPWCGEAPDVTKEGAFRLTDGMKYGALQCCVIGPEVRTDYKDVEHWKAKAIAAWNERAIPQAAAEPVAWLHEHGGGRSLSFSADENTSGWRVRSDKAVPLYAAPDRAPSTDSATGRDAARRLLKAAETYAMNWCQDEAEPADDHMDMICSPQQHAEATELFAAIAAMKGEG